VPRHIPKKDEDDRRDFQRKRILPGVPVQVQSAKFKSARNALLETDAAGGGL